MRAGPANVVATTTVLLAALVPGCRSADPVVATVDGRPIVLSDLDLYLRLNRVVESTDEPRPPALRARIDSRLLDDLIAQTALLGEAERRGVTVGEAEIDAYLGEAEQPSSSVLQPDSAAARRLARRRLYSSSDRLTAMTSHFLFEPLIVPPTSAKSICQPYFFRSARSADCFIASSSTSRAVPSCHGPLSAPRTPHSAMRIAEFRRSRLTL